MLKNKLNTLNILELREIYGWFWQGGENYTKEDILEHISRYIYQFFIIRKYNKNIRLKALTICHYIKSF